MFFSDSLGNLKKLEGLAINNNRLISLPENIWKLNNLKELHCNNNKIERLPESLGKLDKIQRLSLAYNNLFTLPSSIGGMKRIEYLDVSGNKIAFLPKTICLLNLSIYFNSFIAGNNYICDNIHDCIEDFAGFNYEYDNSGIPVFVSQNCSSCNRDFIEVKDLPSTVISLGNNDCYYKKDFFLMKKST